MITLWLVIGDVCVFAAGVLFGFRYGFQAGAWWERSIRIEVKELP